MVHIKKKKIQHGPALQNHHHVWTPPSSTVHPEKDSLSSFPSLTNWFPRDCGQVINLSVSLQNRQKGTVVVRISRRRNRASWGDKVLTVVPGTNGALGADEVQLSSLQLSGRITVGARPVVLSGSEPKKSATLGLPPLNESWPCFHALLAHAFYRGLKDSQSVAERQHVWRQRTHSSFRPRALQRWLCPQGMRRSGPCPHHQPPITAGSGCALCSSRRAILSVLLTAWPPFLSATGTLHDTPSTWLISAFHRVSRTPCLVHSRHSNMELATKFIQVFPPNVIEEHKRDFWPTQYLLNVWTELVITDNGKSTIICQMVEMRGDPWLGYVLSSVLMLRLALTTVAKQT